MPASVMSSHDSSDGASPSRAASRFAALAASASGTSAATRAGSLGTSFQMTRVMTASVPSEPISSAGMSKPALSFASPAMRRTIDPSARTASSPATRARAVP